MNWRSGLALTGIALIAALLAFPLRGAVYQLLVVPLAYLLWLLNLVYLSLSQGIWWIVVIVIAAIVLGRSLWLGDISMKKPLNFHRPERGIVEALAFDLQRLNRGYYSKWLVANRLGKIAYQMLLHREHGKPRSIFAPLTGEGWEAEPHIQSYLEKGLHGSFADFSNRGYFAKPEPTPLDLAVREVVEFLESRQGDGHL